MKKYKGVSLILSLFSGVLMALAFPPFNNSMLAFISLVPIMFAVRKTSKKQTIGLAFLMGFTFFLITLFWLHILVHQVDGFWLSLSVWFGYILLSALCALYFIPPLLFFSISVQRWDRYKWSNNLRLMFIVTVSWVGMEYLRAILFTGFSWNQLGISQYQEIVLIQIASFGGVYAVSALIVWLNVAIYATLIQHIKTLQIRRYRIHTELMLGLLPIALAASFGFQTLFKHAPAEKSIQIALIQPNILQEKKWDKKSAQHIRETLLMQSEMALRIPNLDLIVWPETALPDFFCYSLLDSQLVRKVVSHGTPLLLGTIDVDCIKTGKMYYNSSLLIHPNGSILKRYNKQHLVPFGEYVPFPLLMKKFTPVEVDLKPGNESTLFTLPDQPAFSTLICFEDTVAPLAAKAVRNGAFWLINQSNDAWFKGSIEAEQHLSHCVFRAIENRVPLARCCNYGVSCFIDPHGRIVRKLEPESGGFLTGSIPIQSEKKELTFYTQKGDFFAKAMVMVTGIMALLFFLFSKKRKTLSSDFELDDKNN